MVEKICDVCIGKANASNKCVIEFSKVDKLKKVTTFSSIEERVGAA